MSVSVIGLSKVYGSQKAVDNISFQASKGEVLGFLGPNGAGKSTTMKMLTCFIPQTSGSAEVCGFDTAQSPMEVTKRIGYLPENNPLYLDMYVREYLEFMAGLHKLGPKTKAAVNEMIEMTGLTAEYKKKVGQLSKGYRQRVGIAQAMLHNPEVLILDEPTSGLDPNQLVEIRSLIKRLGKDKTVIFSSHIMQEVQAVADRVVIINKGKIVADDSTTSLQSRITGDLIITVEFKEKAEQNVFDAVKGVKKKTLLPDGKWSLVCDAKNDLREEVFRLAKQKDLTLLSLYKEESTLEEVFKQLTK